MASKSFDTWHNSFFCILVVMKIKRFIGCLLILSLFTFCKKKNTSTNSSNSKVNEKTMSISTILKGGAWVWDSTAFYNNNAAVYCFTKNELKTYTLNTIVTTCQTPFTFSFSFNNNPHNNTGDGSGFLNEPNDAAIFHTAQTELKGTYKNVNDSTINLNEIWGWVVAPDQNNSDIDLNFTGSNAPLHKCSFSNNEFTAFVAGSFVIKDIASNKLVIQRVLNTSSGCDMARYFFHK